MNGANAEGTYTAETIEVKYHDPGDNSRAEIRLRRVEKSVFKP
jgi:hypothetical protein